LEVPIIILLLKITFSCQGTSLEEAPSITFAGFKIQ